MINVKYCQECLGNWTWRFASYFIWVTPLLPTSSCCKRISRIVTQYFSSFFSFLEKLVSLIYLSYRNCTKSGLFCSYASCKLDHTGSISNERTFFIFVSVELLPSQVKTSLILTYLDPIHFCQRMQQPLLQTVLHQLMGTKYLRLRQLHQFWVSRSSIFPMLKHMYKFFSFIWYQGQAEQFWAAALFENNVSFYCKIFSRIVYTLNI